MHILELPRLSDCKRNQETNTLKFLYHCVIIMMRDGDDIDHEDVEGDDEGDDDGDVEDDEEEDDVDEEDEYAIGSSGRFFCSKMQQRFGPRQRQACGECGRTDHDDENDDGDDDNHDDDVDDDAEHG